MSQDFELFSIFSHLLSHYVSIMYLLCNSTGICSICARTVRMLPGEIERDCKTKSNALLVFISGPGTLSEFNVPHIEALSVLFQSGSKFKC